MEWKVYIKGKKDKPPCNATPKDFIDHFNKTGKTLCAEYGDLEAEDKCFKCPFRK